MIKLKTLILEREKLILDKMEEQYAFSVLLNKLVPHVVDTYNSFVSNKKNRNMKKKFYYTTPKEMGHNIKKVNREPNEIEYDCVLRHGHVEFKITKDINPLTNENEIQIGYLQPTDLGWHYSSGYTWYTVDDLANKKDWFL